jgi:hypothetical protein
LRRSDDKGSRIHSTVKRQQVSGQATNFQIDARGGRAQARTDLRPGTAIRIVGSISFQNYPRAPSRCSGAARGGAQVLPGRDRAEPLQPRRADEKVLEHCEQQKIGFTSWYPLAAGDLAKSGGPLDTVAKALGATPGQIALAWVLKRSPVMLPIPGTSSVAHLEENVAVAEIKLTDAEFATLDGAARE